VGHQQRQSTKRKLRARMTIKYFVLLPRDAVLARCIPVFEKTCAATQKNVKCHVFLDFEKKRKIRILVDTPFQKT